MNHAHHLLSDGAGAANRRQSTQVLPDRREPRRPIDAVMLIEMLILCRDEGALQ
jgi:hypothetical protein